MSLPANIRMMATREMIMSLPERKRREQFQQNSPLNEHYLNIKAGISRWLLTEFDASIDPSQLRQIIRKLVDRLLQEKGILLNRGEQQRLVEWAYIDITGPR